MIEKILWKVSEVFRVISTLCITSIADPDYVVFWLIRWLIRFIDSISTWELQDQSQIAIFLTFQVHKLRCLVYLLANLTKTQTVNRKL